MVVVGGANVDVKARTHRTRWSPAPATPAPWSARPAASAATSPRTSPGSARASPSSRRSGSDPDGDWLLEETAAAGVDVVAGAARRTRPARYVAVLDADGELVVGVSDMAATDALGPEVLDHDLLRSAALVVVDGNLPATTVDAVLRPRASASSSTRSASPRRGGSPHC